MQITFQCYATVCQEGFDAVSSKCQCGPEKRVWIGKILSSAGLTWISKVAGVDVLSVHLLKKMVFFNIIPIILFYFLKII